VRLPRPEELTSSAERELYGHDSIEFHDTDHRSFLRRGYLRRIELMRSLIGGLALPGRPLRILDVGCAQGNLALLLAEAGHHVVAADLKIDFLQYVRKKHDHGRLGLVAVNAERLPFGPIFDVVVLGELLEHAAHPDALLNEARRVARPGGVILLSTPNGDFFLNRLPRYSQVAGNEGLEARQYKPDADGHLFLLTSQELRDLVRQAGLRTESLHFFNSPFNTGVAKWRHIGRWLPMCISQVLERLVSRCRGLNARWCSGMIVLARVPK